MRIGTSRDASCRTFPGAHTPAGTVDLSAYGYPTVADVIEAGFEAVRGAVPPDADVVVPATVLAPLVPRSVIGTGTNYRSHVVEMGGTEPARPTANFIKLPGSYAGPGDEIEIPPGCLLDYEAEIAVIVGRRITDADPESARHAIFGLCLANDLSARDAPTSHLTLAKSGPGFCPLGPWITTLDELDLDDVSFVLSVNGEVRQHGHVSDMVHSVIDIVVSFSRSLPLDAGDVILTGSPGGVGVGMDPPTFLADGDVVEVTSPQLGTLTNAFRAAKESA
jgi:acylpyruvate hydrolase